MFDYGFEYSLSIKQQIILLLSLIVPHIDVTLISYIYDIKRSIEDNESIIHNIKTKYDTKLLLQINCLYPNFIMYGVPRIDFNPYINLYPINSIIKNDCGDNGIKIVNLLIPHKCNKDIRVNYNKQGHSKGKTHEDIISNLLKQFKIYENDIDIYNLNYEFGIIKYNNLIYYG